MRAYLRKGTVLKNITHVFALLLRLRQCCLHSSLIGALRPFESSLSRGCHSPPVVSAQKKSVEEERREHADLIGKETMRATRNLGNVWVNEVKAEYKEIVLRRMDDEKEVSHADNQQSNCHCDVFFSSSSITLVGIGCEYRGRVPYLPQFLDCATRDALQG